MFNTYNEEFKTNVVSVVRSGYSVSALAKRLSIPPTSITNWVHHPKYSEVQPASEEVLAALPAPQVNDETKLVPITKTEKKVSPIGEIKIKIGKMEMSLPQNCGRDSLVTLIKALGEAGVL